MMTRKENFVNALKKKTPDLEIKFKDESFLMKVIGLILFFNPGFMRGFVTTIGKTIYFPSRQDLLLRTEDSAIATIAHEYQHVKDYEKNPFWFMFSYLFPISLLPLAILSFIFLPWFVSLALCLLTLAPLPAYWRTKWEVKGYTMSMFVFNKLAIEKDVSSGERVNRIFTLVNMYDKHFTGMNYYLMWPMGVRNQLSDAARDILSGEIEKTDVIFSDVVEALEATRVSTSNTH